MQIKNAKGFSANLYTVIFVCAGLCSQLFSKAQSPEMLVDGKPNNGVILEKISVDVNICGHIATTTFQLDFRNTTTKTLEGNLSLPLKEGASVSKYGLDINGKIREAVPVSRQKGTAVFEAVVRKQIDPGLLEKTGANLFRTRVYPILPGKTRTVVIGFEETLRTDSGHHLLYSIPIFIKDTIKEFSFKAAVGGTAERPLLSFLPQWPGFTSYGKNAWIGNFHATQFAVTQTPEIKVPGGQQVTKTYIQTKNGKKYFFINLPKILHSKPAAKPSEVTIFWDASKSAAEQDRSRIFSFLDTFFNYTGTTKVNIITFGNTLFLQKTFEVKNSRWEHIQAFLSGITYDGATNFDVIMPFLKQNGLAFLFSDGRNSMGSGEHFSGKKRVFCFAASSICDYSRLKLLALKSGGAFINLLDVSSADAVRTVTMENYQFLGIAGNRHLFSHYPSLPVPTTKNLAVSGITESGTSEIELLFGYGNKVHKRTVVRLNQSAESCENIDLARIHAQHRIEELDIDFEKNKAEIEKLGMQFGIVTRNTSLMVLETPEDYVRFGVSPPAELADTCSKIKKALEGKMNETSEKNYFEINDYKTELENWLKNDFPEIQAPLSTPALTTRQNNIQQPAQAAAGQSMRIKGTVILNNGYPVPGAIITNKQTSLAVIADSGGRFDIQGMPGHTLQCSAVGFNTREIIISDSAVIIRLDSMEQSMEEVVVTAFGISTQQRRATASAAVQMVSTLEGRMAGVQVISGSPGSSNSVTIRGTGTISQNNSGDAALSPLYIIDGVAVDPSDINPSDIISVTVLKGNDAISLYGSRAQEGAIIISTKRNHGRGRPLYDSLIKEEDQEDSAKISSLINLDSTGYMNEIAGSKPAERYEKYLLLRNKYQGLPSFYYNTGKWFLDNDRKETGFRILSNLAELETGNHEILKIAGYTFRQYGFYKAASDIFREVHRLRPDDPQSYRDIALLAEDEGDYKKAFDYLKEGLTRKYPADVINKYSGIEETMLIELNHLLSKNKDLTTDKAFLKSIRVSSEFDIRIVLNWNQNNTDIDLWITDPGGEICMYKNKYTKAGGRLSDDFTEGFGPEQFILKKARNGVYQIEAEYFNDNSSLMSGGPMLMADIYINYGKPDEKRKILTIQSNDSKKTKLLIDEVNFRR